MGSRRMAWACGALLATLLVVTEARASYGDAACAADSCQMCATSASCFMQTMAQCRHPACFVAGMAGGLVGGLAGGVMGPLLLTLPAMAAYPDLSPGMAFVGSICVGAGCGAVAVGVPSMLIGEMVGRATDAAGVSLANDPPPPRRRR